MCVSIVYVCVRVLTVHVFFFLLVTGEMVRVKRDRMHTVMHTYFVLCKRKIAAPHLIDEKNEMGILSFCILDAKVQHVVDWNLIWLKIKSSLECITRIIISISRHQIQLCRMNNIRCRFWPIIQKTFQYKIHCSFPKYIIRMKHSFFFFLFGLAFDMHINSMIKFIDWWQKLNNWQ